MQAEYENDPVFRLTYPKSCPGVPSELLDPASSWADKTEFKEVQHELAGLFEKNFAKYASQAPAEVIAQGPAPPAYPVA